MQTSWAAARMTIGERIREKLTAALAPARLDVVDESHMHAGHAGARAGGDSHFRVAVASAAFAGLSRVERQRKVNALLAEEFADGMHALSVTARTPEEDAAARRVSRPAPEAPRGG